MKLSIFNMLLINSSLIAGLNWMCADFHLPVWLALVILAGINLAVLFATQTALNGAIELLKAGEK